MGGIMTGADAVEFLMAGASAVEVGTANFVDPDACGRIIREIEDWCGTHGVDRLQSIVGTLRVP
jgi:dihydroorotate dehydrogenase (NAD+) catalytic subunit